VCEKLNSAIEADSENYLGGSSETICTTSDLTFTRRTDQLLREGCGWSCAPGRQDRIDPARAGLPGSTRCRQPRTMAMEATIFTGWIYDHLLPHAEKVKVAHPLMLRAIAAARRKRKTRSTRPRLPIACAATFCPSATWLPPRSATDAGCCGTATLW